jgi:glycosyltransferase involved in cell wall biosynthesis
LKIVCQNGKARLVTIGASELDLNLTGIPSVVKPWSEESEVKEMQKFDVGIMPLADTPWEQGKCGHKLIQYMGCARPVVASPVGVNSTIVQEGKTGFLAATTEEWVTALEKLRGDKNLRESMGQSGRRIVEQCFSLSVTAPRLAALLEEAARGQR